MKKIFFSALAALSLVACVQEAVVDTPQGDAIAFENAFVDNATRATSLTAGNLNAFRVWGFINNTSGVLFDGTKVTGGGQSWNYEGTKYWIPEQEYYFAALAPVNENGVVNATVSPASGDDAKLGLGTVNFTNDGQTDLIYAQAMQKGVQSGNAPVAFTFKHLLSKVKFTFTPAMGMDEQKITAEVTDIKMTAPKTASINLAAATPVWGDHAEKVILDFGAATAGTELFAIPTAAYDYLITFTVTIKQDGNKILTVNKASTVNGLALEMGKAYNFTATINHETLNFEEIVFNVDGVEAWDTTAPNVDFVPATPVKTTLELMAAIEAGENVVLTEDINLDDLTKATPQPLVINKDITLDGNGHTLRSTATRAINVSGANEVTIKNVNIVATGERAINVIQNTKKVNIENVTATAANYTVNVAGSAPNAIVNIVGSTLNGLNTVNVAAPNVKVTVNNSTVNCNDNNTTAGESYSALCLNKAAVGAEIIATNTVVNVTDGSDSSKGRNGAEDGTVTINGSTEDVTVTIAVITYPGSDNYYGFETVASAIEFAKETDVISLIRNISVEETIVVEEGKTITLDLNGKTITAGLKEEGRHYYAIDNYGTLVIEGTGAINARGIENFGTMTINGDITITNVDTNGGAAIWNEGKLTINAGTYTTNENAGAGTYGSALNTQATGEAIVNGGTFKAYSQLTYAIFNEGTTTINYAEVKGKHGAVAGSETNDRTTINGGTFELMENPGVSDHCVYMVSEIKGGSFTLGNNTDCGAQVFYKSTIAEGYEAVEIGNGYWKVQQNLINTAAELTEALVAKKAEIFLEGGAEIEGTFNIDYPVIITSPADNKATIKGRIESQSSAVVTYLNIKFDYNDASVADWNNTQIAGQNPKGHPAIIGTYASKLTFNNCEFNFKSGYSVNKAPGALTLYGSSTLKMENCTLSGEGNPIYGQASVEITGSTVEMFGNNAILNLSYFESQKVIFKNNTVTNKSTNGSLIYGVQFLSTNGKDWKNVYFDVQGNTGLDEAYVPHSSYTFPGVTYGEGSATL